MSPEEKYISEYIAKGDSYIELCSLKFANVSPSKTPPPTS
jgi:hypothetical protein